MASSHLTFGPRIIEEYFASPRFPLYKYTINSVSNFDGNHEALAYLAPWFVVTQLPRQLLAQPTTDNTGNDLYVHAIRLMTESPLIDTHVDLPQIIRGLGTF